MTRSRRRMMAEATVESPTSILPEEIMIEIFYRVELNSILQLRCVCKSWKSLVLDPQFIEYHIFRLIDDITVLCLKASELFKAFQSQYLINHPVIPQEHEQVDDVDEEAAHEQEQVDDEDGEEAAQEDDIAVEEDDDEEKEEKEEKEEEEGEKHKKIMTALAQLDGFLVNVRSVKEELKDLKGLKDDLKLINLDTQIQIQAAEDSMKCLRSFMRICLKSETSSSSSSHS